MLELVSKIDEETQFSKVKPFDLGGLEKARPIKDFAPTLKRTKNYDLGRIKFFIDNPDQIGIIFLEEDEDGSLKGFDYVIILKRCSAFHVDYEQHYYMLKGEER